MVGGGGAEEEAGALVGTAVGTAVGGAGGGAWGAGAETGSTIAGPSTTSGASPSSGS